MYHQGNFKVVDIYILSFDPLFSNSLGATLDAGLENEGALIEDNLLKAPFMKVSFRKL